MTTGFIIGAGGGAVEIVQNTDLLRAGDKKVQFMCSQESPVKVRFVDGTEQELTSIEDLDLSNKDKEGDFQVCVTPQGTSFAPDKYYEGTRFSNFSMTKGTGTTYPTVDSEGNASGFANRNGMLLPKRFNPADKSWEMQWCFTTPTPATRQDIVGSSNNTDYWYVLPIINNSKMVLYLSSNGTSWNLANATAGATTIVANTKYWYRLSFDGTQYVGKLSTTGEFTGEETTEHTLTSSTPIFAHYYPMWIGNNLWTTSTTYPFLGTIHLQDCWIKIDGEYFWQPYTDKPVRGDFNLTFHGSPLTTPNYEMFLFSTANYITLPKKLPDTFSTLEAVIQYNSRNGAISTNQNLFNLSGTGSAYGILIGVSSKPILYISSNGSSWDIGQHNGTTTLLANTNYWFKYIFDGTTHKLYSSTTGKFAGEEIEEVSVTNSSLPKMTSTPALGYAWTNYPCLGSIKVDYCYIKVDGEYFWKPLNEDVVLVQNNQGKKFDHRDFTDSYYGTDVYTNVNFSNTGTVTLDSNKAITAISSNYATQTKNSLEQVNIHTVGSYSRVIEDELTELNMAPFNFTSPNWSDYVSVTANTECKYHRDGVFYPTAVAEIVLTEADGTVTEFPAKLELKLRAGDKFTSTVAGKFYFY